ncbi:MAG: hypothetical protein KME10_10980 [Plectolyngbya sp. WJT66-NPBG17]|jgi:hypothetical protein|nr:hypothetical protein [Plectolyngbya sp. WJT66-NPBG17]MBW4524996.1 hypothetical protein [Phormidium tanganyikae FI6-MK23]
MATSRGNQTNRRVNNRRTAAKVTGTPESSAPTAETSPIADAPNPKASESIANEQVNPPISEPAPETDPQTPFTELTPKESPMSKSDVIDATATPAEGKGSALEILSLPSLSAGNRPVMSDDFEVAGTIQAAGIRPIEASHLAVYGTILNGRPIMSSSLRVAEMLPGNRPIFYSDFHSVEGSETLGRPVMVSDPGLLSADRHMGDRPVFSNDLDDSTALMGFID